MTAGAGSAKTELQKLQKIQNTVSGPLPECCPGPGGLPPRPRIVVLGETGVGKSTLGNQLFGKKPGMCASENSMLNLTHPVFGVGHSMTAHTNETAWIAGKWLGDYSGNSPCFTVIDTPGVGDTSNNDMANVDCKHGTNIAEAVRNLSPIDVFVLIFKGTTSRFTKPLQDQLSFYEELLGEDFWKQAIIEISYWRSSDDARDERKEDRQTDEGKLTHDLNMQLRKKFSLAQDIPVYFVDPMYSPSRGRRNPEEKATFKNETEKLWNFTQSGDPYTCKGHCKAPGFLEGKPSLKSEPNVNARLKDKVIMQFSVWFSGCDGKGDRSYDIYKDGVKIWTVIDDQGEKGKERKPKTMVDNVNTPPNMRIFDECSQLDGKGHRRQCNIALSKYKNIKVVLKGLTEDCFGSYYVNNTNGRSEEVHIEKMVDGFYSAWTEWSAWDPDKGAKERKRVCTEPVNGGAPCDSQGPPTELCNSDQCAEASTYSRWSDWKCQQVCYNPYKKLLTHEIKTRTCTDASPMHSTQNCAMMSHTTENSNRECNGRSAVPQCPEMTLITSKVCPGYYDGTNDNVQLEFKNNYHSDPPETCMTDYLANDGPAPRPDGPEFNAGATERWYGEELLSCNGPRFRPLVGLYFRFHTNTAGWNLHHDQLRLCSLQVQFGRPGTAGYSLWKWAGDLYNEHYTGWFNSQSW